MGLSSHKVRCHCVRCDPISEGRFRSVVGQSSDVGVCCLQLNFDSGKMPDNKKEQCLTIKILHGMNLASKQIHRRLVAMHNQHAYSLSLVHRWVNCFAAGKVNIVDRACSGRPTKLTPALLNQLVSILCREPRTSLATLARDLQVSVGTVHKALKKQLRWKKHPTRWVPHQLTNAQRNRG